MLGYEAAVDAINAKMKRDRYQTVSPTERYDIGKHVIENGTVSTLRKFKNKFPILKESTL